MRADLPRDPKTVLIADYLSRERAFMSWLTDPVQQFCKESAYEHVTRNVTVALCVTGLLVTWGIARDRGDRDGDDLVLDKCRLNTIDELSGVPCFGQAMASVGWAVEEAGEVVRFPKFFKENESPEDRHRRQNAERQARFRGKRKKSGSVTGALQGNVTNNADVTHREEKRREEKNKPKPIASSDLSLSAVNGSAVAYIPLVDGTEYGITTNQLQEFELAYPALDCKQTFLEMRAWCISNPSLRKTRSGVLRFVNTWLSKEQNKARGA